jgi:hypothetical protein
MLKNLSKKITMVCMCATLITSSSLSVFASTDSKKTIKASSQLQQDKLSKDYNITLDGINYPLEKLKDTAKSSSSSNTMLASTSISTLVDNQTISETISGGKIYNINVSDFNQRRIMIGSTGPVKVLLTAPSLSNLVSYDSGYFRIGCKVSTNFIPGMDYQLLVVPQNGETSVNVNMTSTTDSSWVTHDSYTIEEKNLLMGGQFQIFDVAFKNTGTYKITVSTNISKLVASVQTLDGYNNSALLQASEYSFIINARPTYNIQDYKIILSSLQEANSGGAYTVRIEKIG